MPTRQGWTVVVAAVLAIVIGRIFGIIELFVIGAGLALAVAGAVATVRLGRSRLAIVRWVHPSMLTVGDTGRVDLLIENTGSAPSPRVDLSEPVGDRSTAQMSIASLRPGGQVTAGYRVPAHRRGVLSIGPTLLERRDVLGLAEDVRVVTGETDVAVAPRTLDLAMPGLGRGALGRQLAALSQRIGPGEFHSLRDYAAGDELRSIHWRASARSDGLKVRQYEAQGVRRCIVVLDRDATAYPEPTSDTGAPDSDAFERAVVAAASIVLAADRAGLTTRFVTAGADIRGPEVAAHTLAALASITPGGRLDDIERDPGEGLGLLVVVTASMSTDGWRQTDRAAEPTLTRIGIVTADTDGIGRMAVDATSLAAFRAGWQRLTGAPVGRRASSP